MPKELLSCRMIAVAAATGALLTSAVSAPATGTPTTTPQTAPAATNDDPPGKLLLMLDASGSMKTKDPSGLTKIDAAKKALTSVITALPDNTPVGLRVYGARVDSGGKPTPAACNDTQLITPIAPVNKPAMTATINTINALGETPIAGSLKAALTDLGTTGKRNIVLVSDGEESCVPDPCPVIKQLTQNGINLQIDNVGFGVNTTARQQLQCIADAGNGTYYDAKDAQALTTSLTKLSQRALRPFTVDGTPIKGTTSPADAPTLTPGQYIDTLAAKSTVHYKIARAPEGTLHASATMRPPRGSSDGIEEIRIEAQNDQGQRCESDTANRIGMVGFYESLVMSLSVDGTGNGDCAQGPLTLAITRGNGDGPVPVELLIMDEPPVLKLEALQPEVTMGDRDAIVAPPASGTPRPIIGGGSFSDAPTLTPGTYIETVMPGEQLFYKTKLDYGQSAAFGVDLPAPGTPVPELSGADAIMIQADAFSPDRHQFSHAFAEPSQRATLHQGAPVTANSFVPEVRYRNRDGNPLRIAPASLPGFYTFTLTREFERASSSANVPVTVRIRIGINGTPQGQPTYASAPAPTTSASTTSSAGTVTQDARTAAAPVSTTNNSSPWVTRGLGALVLLAAAAGGFWAYRRRGATSPPTAH